MTVILAALFALSIQGAAVKVSAVLWDFSDSDAPISVFTVCVDAACSQITPEAAKTVLDANAGAGNSTYAFPIPALKPGDHTATVKACNKNALEVCGPGATVSFKLVVVPGAPTGIRVK